MRHARSIALALLAPSLAAMTPGAAAQTPELEVRLAHDSEAERATRAQLLALTELHDLSPWVRTTEILVDETEIPHSHPVLTLHTRHLGDDPQLLSTFLHEQLHWVALEHDDATDAAVQRFSEVFPEVPARDAGGAGNDGSTWLHLVVCDMEFQALSDLLGEPEARAILGAKTYYRWIYDQVLGNPVVREVNREHGILR